MMNDGRSLRTSNLSEADNSIQHWWNRRSALLVGRISIVATCSCARPERYWSLHFGQIDSATA
jgi:hypothetical protein